MSEKVLDKKGRWRNKIVAFRMSEAEADRLNDLVEISGLTKQDYLIHRVLQEDVVVTGNPRVFKILNKKIDGILELLYSFNSLSDLSDEDKEWIENILKLSQKLNHNPDQV